MKEAWKNIVYEVTGGAPPCDFRPITAGGSFRHFYRVFRGDGSFILLESTPEDLQDYLSMCRFFTKHRINAPAELANDPLRGLAAFEDLGDDSLYSLAKSDNRQYFHKTMGLYKKTIDLLIKMQNLDICLLPERIRSRKFDYAHYRWESSYFQEKFLGLYLGWKNPFEPDLDRELESLALQLEKEPPVPVHRDLQSQNILIHRDQPCLIDFQSARAGSPYYDVASLLQDPYVDLPCRVQQELFAYYCKKSPLGECRPHTYRLICCQRLMQALGAYGKLGIGDGKRIFLTYIPSALGQLYRVLENLPELKNLKGLIEKIIIKPEQHPE